MEVKVVEREVTTRSVGSSESQRNTYTDERGRGIEVVGERERTEIEVRLGVLSRPE